MQYIKYKHNIKQIHINCSITACVHITYNNELYMLYMLQLSKLSIYR